MTHAEKVLQLLSDGEPHNSMELYRLGVMAHSRVADLRKRGHVIICSKQGGEYTYQLWTVPEEELTGQTAAAHGASVAPPRGPSPGRSTPPDSLSAEIGEAPEPGLQQESPPLASPAPRQLSVFEAAE